MCTSIDSNRCLNISLSFPPPQRTILPLRLSVIQAPNFRPPIFDDESESELHINQSDSPSSLIASNKTTNIQSLISDVTTSKSHESRSTSLSNIWMLFLGIFLGLLLAGLSFMIYYIIWNKNRPKIKKEFSPKDRIIRNETPPLIKDRSSTSSGSKRKSSTHASSDSATNHLIESPAYSTTHSSSEWTTVTTSSSSYRPDIIL
jgi:cytoskeletal protein RodZ